MSGYKFIRKQRNKFGGGIPFYINDQLSSRTIEVENPSMQRFNSCCRDIQTTKLSETNFATSLKTIISKLSNKYEQLILMGDFNMTTSNPILSQLLDKFALSSLNIDPTCFKNSKPPSFMKTNIFETGT